MSTQSKSFLIVLVLILVVSYAVIELADHFKTDRLPNQEPRAQAQSGLVPTEDWVAYADKTYPLVFRYPRNWKVSEIKTEPDYYVIAITPAGKNTEMRVYINGQDFYALKGFESSPRRIGNQPGADYGPTLAAVKVGSNYYTFDSGQDISLVPEFQTILATVEFR